MTLIEQIHERVRDLPDDAVVEVLDFIEFIHLKLARQCIRTAPGHPPSMESPSMRWDVQTFLDRCAGVIPDFPDIEDEGAAQEREWME
ncbi:MAG: DUF2281 domain-containing protein [Magnetococcus sp. YQC-5]